MTKITTLLIPGLDGSPASHWQDWWAATDPSALMVDLSTPSAPSPEQWEIEVAGAILIHPNVVLVGHSLGAVLIARLMEKWPQLKVTAALMVAPVNPYTSARTVVFAPLPKTRLGIPATVVASRNDPWMSFSQASTLALSWEAEIVDLGFAGHINTNTASGFGPWPAGKTLRDALHYRFLPKPQPQQDKASQYTNWHF